MLGKPYLLKWFHLSIVFFVTFWNYRLCPLSLHVASRERIDDGLNHLGVTKVRGMLCNIWSGDGHVDTWCLSQGITCACKKAKAAFKFAERPSPFPSMNTLWLKSHPTNMKTVPSWELTYPFSKHFLSRMIFRFQRWDMNNSFLGIGTSSFLRLKNAALRSFFLLGKAWRICCLFWQAGSSKKTPRHSYRLQFPNSQYPGKAIQQIGGKLSIGFLLGKSHVWRFFGNFGMMMTQLGLFLYRIFRASKKTPLAFSLLLQAKTRFTTSSGGSTIEPCWSWTASDWDPVATIQPAETRKFNGISVWNPKNSCFSGAGVDCLKTRPNRWVARRVECSTVAEEQRLHSCCQRSLCSKPFSFDKMRVWPFWTATRELEVTATTPCKALLCHWFDRLGRKDPTWAKDKDEITMIYNDKRCKKQWTGEVSPQTTMMWLATCFSLAVPPPEQACLDAVYQVAAWRGHIRRTFNRGYATYASILEIYHRDILHMIPPQSSCSSLTTRWSKFVKIIGAYESSFVTMSITHLHGLSVDFEKTHHVFPTTRQESSTDRGFFFSQKKFICNYWHFGSSVICPPFRNMGEGDERPGSATDPTVTAPPSTEHPLGSTRPRDEDRDGDRGDRGGGCFFLAVGIRKTGRIELKYEVCEMETACFELCEKAIFFLRRQRRKRRTKQALHWTVSWHQRTDKQMVHPRCLMAHPAIAWNVRQLATRSVAKQHGAFDSLYVKCLGCKACT